MYIINEELIQRCYFVTIIRLVTIVNMWKTFGVFLCILIATTVALGNLISL